MLNFGASKPRVRGGARAPPPGSAPGHKKFFFSDAHKLFGKKH